MLSWGWAFIGILFYLVIDYGLTLGYEQGRVEERENWEDWLRSEMDAGRLIYISPYDNLHDGFEEQVINDAS